MKTIYDVSIVLINQIDDVLTSIQYRRHYRCVISVHWRCSHKLHYKNIWW